MIEQSVTEHNREAAKTNEGLFDVPLVRFHVWATAAQLDDVVVSALGHDQVTAALEKEAAQVTHPGAHLEHPPSSQR